jgi:hypothetical protein
VEYLSIFQPETPILRQEVPKVSPEMPDVPLDERQETFQVMQLHNNDLKMSEFSWRDLSMDEKADEHLINHFCKLRIRTRPSLPSRHSSPFSRSTWSLRAPSRSRGLRRAYSRQ